MGGEERGGEGRGGEGRGRKGGEGRDGRGSIELHVLYRHMKIHTHTHTMYLIICSEVLHTITCHCWLVVREAHLSQLHQTG